MQLGRLEQCTRASAHKRAKAKLTAAVTQLLPPSDNTGMPGTTQTLEPCVANPPGAGLVTCKRTVQVPRIEATEPKAPQRPHIAQREMDS